MISNTEYTFSHYELRDKLLPILKDKIFHVTSYERFIKIQKSGFIKSNADGKLGYTFSQNSYGRKRGYICLFDLRSKTDEEINIGLECLYFLDIHDLGDKQVHLIFNEEYDYKLIDTKQAKAEIGFKELWIPYVECWYPEDLPLSNIKDMITVNIKRNPEVEALVKEMKAIAKKSKRES